MARMRSKMPSNGWPHREHRSKSGRRYWPEKWISRQRKDKISKSKIIDIENEQEEIEHFVHGASQ